VRRLTRKIHGSLVCADEGIVAIGVQALARAGNFRAMTDALRKSSRPGTFSEQDFDAYREAWRQPGAPTAMINWYRVLRASAATGNPMIEIPVRILWGAQDRFLAAELAELSLRYCKRGELTMFPDATHWLQHEEQESVSRALVPLPGVPRTGLWKQSNQSPLPEIGNWKKVSRDRRPKPAPNGQKCR
jgi:pimeloyl-ACP methyl ester carboxylesterase